MQTHCLIVHGRVQRVGFRCFVQETARSMGLAGTVENLPTGQVRIYVNIDAQILPPFRQRISHGLPLARVDRLEESVVTGRSFDGFTIVG